HRPGSWRRCDRLRRGRVLDVAALRIPRAADERAALAPAQQQRLAAVGAVAADRLSPRGRPRRPRAAARLDVLALGVAGAADEGSAPAHLATQRAAALRAGAELLGRRLGPVGAGRGLGVAAAVGALRIA